MEDLDQLQKRRAEAQEVRDQERLRALYGEKLVAVVAKAMGRSLTLDDFNDRGELSPIDWPTDIREAPGLVAAYISTSHADKLLACARERLSALSGKIGFHDKPYLGFAEVHGVDPMILLAVAESTEDSVVFYSDTPAGVMMVDCYMSQPSEPFSIVVQGAELVEQLASCFSAQVKGGADG